MITKQELSTIQNKAPLLSEGAISPFQVSNMSKRIKAEWKKNKQLRYNAEAEFREQNKTQEEKDKEKRVEEEEKINDRIGQIKAQIRILKDFPRVKSKRMNNTKRTYLNYQKELNSLIKLKGGLENGNK